MQEQLSFAYEPPTQSYPFFFGQRRSFCFSLLSFICNQLHYIHTIPDIVNSILQIIAAYYMGLCIQREIICLLAFSSGKKEKVKIQPTKVKRMMLKNIHSLGDC